MTKSKKSRVCRKRKNFDLCLVPDDEAETLSLPFVHVNTQMDMADERKSINSKRRRKKQDFYFTLKTKRKLLKELETKISNNNSDLIKEKDALLSSYPIR